VASQKETGRSLVTRYWQWLAIAALVVIAVLGWRMRWGPAGNRGLPAEPDTRQITFNPTEEPVSLAVISPDGKYIAYGDLSGLHLRQIDTGETSLLPVPEGFCFH
jgi:hypothetical protein